MLITLTLAMWLAATPVPAPQPAFTAAEAASFVNRWLCDSYSADPDENALVADRPAGPKVAHYPVDKKRGVYIGKNDPDEGIVTRSATPVSELVWAKDVRAMAGPFGAHLSLTYLPTPTTCTRGACLFAFPDGGRSWFAFRRDKRKELIVGIFPVQDKAEPTADAKFTAWLDGIDALFGVATAPK